MVEQHLSAVAVRDERWRNLRYQVLQLRILDRRQQRFCNCIDHRVVKADLMTSAFSFLPPAVRALLALPARVVSVPDAPLEGSGLSFLFFIIRRCRGLNVSLGQES